MTFNSRRSDIQSEGNATNDNHTGQTHKQSDNAKVLLKMSQKSGPQSSIRHVDDTAFLQSAMRIVDNFPRACLTKKDMQLAQCFYRRRQQDENMHISHTVSDQKVRKSKANQNPI